MIDISIIGGNVMSNLLEFKRSYSRASRYFYELSDYSEHTYERKLIDFYNHITKDVYMEPYFSNLKASFSELNVKYKEELKKGAVFIPENKEDRVKTTIGFMNVLSKDSGSAYMALHQKYKGKYLDEKYSYWFRDIAVPIFNDVFSEIEFDIQAIENKQENKNKDDENIRIPQNIITYNGGNHNTQIGNNNVQNIITDEVIGELNQSDMYKNEDNRSVVLENIKDMRDELDKEEPSEERVKSFMKKVIDTGEDKVITWAFEHFGKIPTFISVIPELFK